MKIQFNSSYNSYEKTPMKAPMPFTNTIAFKAINPASFDSFQGGIKISSAELNNILAGKSQQITSIVDATIDVFKKHLDDGISQLSALIIKPFQKKDELIPEYQGILGGLIGKMNKTEQDAFEQIDAISKIPENAPEGIDAEKTIKAFNSATKAGKTIIGVEKDSTIRDFQEKWQEFYYTA